MDILSHLSDAQLQWLFYGALFALVTIILAISAVVQKIMRGAR